mgnify:CR=1 FL=1
MRFTKTLDLWAPGIQESIQSGEIKLQRGQWCRCGTQGTRCRYVGQLGRGLWVTHWQGSPTATNDKFIDAVQAFSNYGQRRVAR